ncbi:MAG: undecaprenyl/decaprenyl-phosphate alpha-N-acetylglucosaminyl 1-phosphate transferase [Thermoleophilaceae bacterium]|nr:undecaprenyl/decaprenyl-phosphate alpha-N-acetylglucosaminyl 1-phosphate transferase [Thermoleophilaceae bacterium]
MTELDAVWAFLVAAAAALVATPAAAALARRVGALDAPKERGLHDRPMPRLGGLAILGGALLAGLLFLPVDVETRGILVGAGVAALVGALDDTFDLPAAAKLAGQVLAAAVPVLSEVRVENVTLPLLGPLDFGPVLGGALTLVGIVAVMNVVNFSDGVDGLAAGVCVIAAVTFAAIALSLDRVDAGILAGLTAGAAIGFLPHNFHPASIFMGDSGSSLLGLLLACVAIQGVLKTAAVVALAFPLVILAVPILDTGFVVAKRIKYRRPVYLGDRSHFHHRFANIGFSQRRTVLYLYGWTLALAGLALALRFVPYSDGRGDFDPAWTGVLAAAGLAAAGTSVYLVYILEILKFRRFRERQLRREALVRGVTPPAQADIEAEITREVQTGEFVAIGAEEEVRPGSEGSARPARRRPVGNGR